VSTRTFAAVNRRAVALGALAVFSAASRAQGDASPEDATRDVVTRFERALQDHDVPAIAALVADDIVVFENGHRNDGWQDFRDNHLVPEMKGPKHPMKGAVVKLRATPQMAWAYTRTELFADPEKPRKVSHVLWSVYVLEPRPEGWKILSLDWSIGKQK
jgi:ketosteroid isomerase-like protein